MDINWVQTFSSRVTVLRPLSSSGVTQRFHLPFVECLADNGFVVVTYDTLFMLIT
jgi:hypothetical protein